MNSSEDQQQQDDVEHPSCEDKIKSSQNQPKEDDEESVVEPKCEDEVESQMILEPKRDEKDSAFRPFLDKLKDNPSNKRAVEKSAHAKLQSKIKTENKMYKNKGMFKKAKGQGAAWKTGVHKGAKKFASASSPTTDPNNDKNMRKFKKEKGNSVPMKNKLTRKVPTGSLPNTYNDPIEEPPFPYGEEERPHIDHDVEEQPVPYTEDEGDEPSVRHGNDGVPNTVTFEVPEAQVQPRNLSTGVMVEAVRVEDPVEAIQVEALERTTSKSEFILLRNQNRKQKLLSIVLILVLTAVIIIVTTSNISTPPTTQPMQQMLLPSLSPTIKPSLQPSITQSLPPTEKHSMQPSTTFAPSNHPSTTVAPSNQPSTEPTFEQLSVTTVNAVQLLELADGVSRRLNDTEIEIFQDLMVSYTINFGARQGRDDGRVDATCKINGQDILNKRRLLWNSWDDNFLSEPQKRDDNKMNLRLWEYPALFSRRLSESFINVKYEMTYTSIYSETASYNQGFIDHVNNNLTGVVQDMKEAGLDIVETALAVLSQPLQSPGSPCLAGGSCRSNICLDGFCRSCDVNDPDSCASGAVCDPDSFTCVRTVNRPETESSGDVPGSSSGVPGVGFPCDVNNPDSCASEAVCRNGLCRLKCDMNDPDSCESVSGTAVCDPDSLTCL